MKIKHGLTENIPFDDYLNIDAQSTTNLKQMLVTPKNYKWIEDHPNEKAKPNRAMQLGTLAHKCILEPERIKTECVAVNVENKTLKAYKEAVKDNPGKEVLTLLEQRTVQDIMHAVDSEPFARELLENGTSEVTMLWNEPAYKYDMKGRIDRLKHEHILVDVKVTGDGNPIHWKRNALWNLRYNVQAYIYTRGYTNITGHVPEFYFIVVENKAPFDCIVYKCDEYFIDEGGEYATKAMERLTECIETGKWPGYSEGGIIPLTASEYWYNKHLKEKGNKKC